MADIFQRPFSKDYSGLINQSVLAGCIITICVTSHELMKRKRRGKKHEKPLGSVESWEFGYLFQGRSWAKLPSPPHPQGWPLSWVNKVVKFPEAEFCRLRGVDATVYCRFIRGCFWFTVLHAFTTTVVLLPIHIKFSDSAQYSSKSMTRALISSLVSTEDGKKLLWIHLVLLLWVTFTWIFTLTWISKGAFRFRAQSIEAAAERERLERERNTEIAPHPHPQYPFQSVPPIEREEKNKGLRLRTVMITNLPSRLRSERELREYFEYYMSRPLAKPSLGIASSTQPGLINKLVSFLINRARKHGFSSKAVIEDSQSIIDGQAERGEKPVVERVVVVRKMTELSSLLERREEMLRKLETAHIRLARKVLTAVQEVMDEREHGITRIDRATSRLSRLSGFHGRRSEGKTSGETDLERASPTLENEDVPENRTELLVRTLGPYVEEFGMRDKRGLIESLRLCKGAKSTVTGSKKSVEKRVNSLATYNDSEKPTVWEALFSLPRSTLNEYQPLVHLNALFRGRAVPAIDYYTTKVNLLTSLITECRARAISEYDAVSTAFVTFEHPDDARRACKYLAVHPKNPLACSVTMAPEYEDLDWIRLMKQTYKAELLKDWVVDVGVWAFTIIWVIPVSLLVALVTISNIATVIPGLKNFLDRHKFLQEIIESLLPTLLTSLLMLLVPLILLLISKKAHTINTLSAMHDRILTRYHKFLVANILVFFCVGVSALESFFTSFKTSSDVLQVVGESFPTAGPFYVGWFIFTTAIHGGIELALFGLPLIVYPSTKRQLTPRKRAIGIRPRTFNYYYWLPNHVLTVILTLVFAVLNPLLMPFVVVYYLVEMVVIKNQLLHVYAKNYEGNGHLILIRIVRYTLDGLILAQVIFLGFMAINKKEVHVALTAIMIFFTVLVKLVFTRILRSKFEAADIVESHVVCGVTPAIPSRVSSPGAGQSPIEDPVLEKSPTETRSGIFKTWKLPKGFRFNYSAAANRNQVVDEHKPIPFDDVVHFKRLHSLEESKANLPVTLAPEERAERLSVIGLGLPLQSSPESSPKGLIFGKPPLVTPHEKHPAWDDSARLDNPYDNPYYTRPILNHLWLPRDPVGILDLDDTVNVFRALTSDPSLGQLGEWIEEGIALADLPDLPPSPSFSDLSLVSGRLSVDRVTSREFSGREEIDLPQEISERVENIHKEANVEKAGEFGSRPSTSHRRPSLFGRNTSSSNNARRRSTSQARPILYGSDTPQRCRTPSFLSNNQSLSPSILRVSPPRRRSTGLIHEVHHPPYSRSHISFTASHNARPRTASGQSTPISTRDAVVGEVIEEEYRATESRMRDEAQSEKQSAAPSTRSWLTSWMYSKVPFAL